MKCFLSKSTQGIPKQELIDIELGEHFHLEIAFDTTKFEFRIKYNGGEMEPFVVPTADYYFSNATIHGNLNITYMGFPYIGEPGLPNHALHANYESQLILTFPMHISVITVDM